MKLLGVISDHRAHNSKSPAMHNRVLKGQNLPGAYLPLAVVPEGLAQAVAGLRALGFKGANVTVPYKEKVGDLLDRLSPEARAIGAVNTIVLEEGSLVGHNTDVRGFASALSEIYRTPVPDRALVMGTGGAARAVVQALTRMGLSEITLCGRTRPQPGGVFDQTRWLPLAGLTAGHLRIGLVVNATSASAHGEAPDLAALLTGLELKGCRLVFDLNYGRQENIWRDLAERSGADFTDGLNMLAHQAAESFQLWTGQKVAAAEFRAALEEKE